MRPACQRIARAGMLAPPGVVGSFFPAVGMTFPARVSAPAASHP
jgi:hypothetical protein